MQTKSKLYEYRFKTSILKTKLVAAEKRANDAEEQLKLNSGRNDNLNELKHKYEQTVNIEKEKNSPMIDV